MNITTFLGYAVVAGAPCYLAANVAQPVFAITVLNCAVSFSISLSIGLGLI